MKHKSLYFTLLISIFLLSLSYSCKKENIRAVPTVLIANITEITASSAKCIGEISSDGGSPLIERGICWSLTKPMPTVTDSKTINVTNTKNFTSSITGLSPGLTYYLRAYATNSIGTAYSSQVTFATLTTAPILTTTELSFITSVSVSCGGNINADGGIPISSRGVCWSIKQNPTIADNKLINGEGVGIFTSNIMGLTPNTTYYLRAYATNNKETGYGNEVTFKTIDSGIVTVTDINGNVYNTITIGKQVWMAENLRSIKYRNGDPIPRVLANAAWSASTTGAYCVNYGGRNLYNWYAVTDIRNITPLGWHIPDVGEWAILANFLGGQSIAGGKLKEIGNTHWNTPNTGASNVTGFDALPSGGRYPDGSFYDRGTVGCWWSTYTVGRFSQLSYNSNSLLFNIGVDEKTFGFSVRCVKD